MTTTTSSHRRCLVALTFLALTLIIVPREAKSDTAFVWPLRKRAGSLDHTCFLKTVHAFRPTFIRYPLNNNPCTTAHVHAAHRQRKHGSDGGLFERLRLRTRIRAWLKTVKWAAKARIKTTKVNQPMNDDVVSIVEALSGLPDNVDMLSTGITEEHDNPKRWAVASNTTDFSGVWKPIVTSKFREEYDEYLRRCGESIIFRRAMLSAVGFLKEIVEQKDQGRELYITGTTPIGRWKRTLIASGYDRDEADTPPSLVGTKMFEPVFSTFQDPDGDIVSVESWWEDNGRVHKSWLRGKPRVHGGEFESTRFLEGDNNEVLVCESTFHPSPNCDSDRFQPANVEWRFRRE